MDELLVNRDDPIATVTINRPHVKNACTPAMWDGLHDIFTELGFDPSVRVVVVTGAGDDFCSGADVSGQATRDQRPLHGVEQMRKVADAVLALHDIPKPVIARVAGVAAGAGMNMALGCDLIVASDRARFSEIFARRGLSIDFGGSWLLPRLIGLHRAKELAFFADVVDAETAERFGLVNRVVAHDQLDSTVGEWAERLAAGPPIALAGTKALLNNSFENSLGEALVDEARAQTINFASADVKEAAIAWLEKRDANFEGR